jgi:hypothetical protein
MEAWYNVNVVSPNVNKILLDVDSLNGVEREELLRLLAGRSNGESGMAKQEQLQRRLVDEGLLSHVPHRKKDAQRYRQWQPVAIQGKSLSQTIVEERR